MPGPHRTCRAFRFGLGGRAAPPSSRGASVRPPLLELQEEACFYCHRRIRDGGHVDHFAPRSRYPVDLGHNFVATHERCNLSKSDFLAGEKHLERWARRNDEASYNLERVFQGAGMGHDLSASLPITRWAYR